MASASPRRVVVTGIGPVTPIGIGLEPFWDGLMAGRSATRPLTELPGGFPVETLASRITARVSDEDIRRHAPITDPDRRMVLGELALRLGLDDADLAGLPFGRGGVVLGNAVGAPIVVEDAFRRMDDGEKLDGRRGTPELLGHLSFHTPAHRLGSLCGETGRTLTLSTGCTAGIDAIGAAFEMIRNDRADVVVTGSAEAPLAAVVYAAFERIGALSCRNHEPERASRPFDEGRDGFVLAEGATLLVLESLEHATRRRARVYAEIRGFASVSNAFHMTQLPPDGIALADCIRRALKDARVAPEEIDHVNAHGSSTPQNDLCETNAVKAVFGPRAREEMTVNSLKAMIGHALGASNAIEVGACALGFARDRWFPTANHERPGEGCDLDYIPNVPRERHVRNLVKLSSGFSGIHSVLVMGQAP